MPFDQSFLALALIVIAAFAVEVVTGFGPMIIGLGLGTFFYPLSVLLPILVLLDTIVCAYLAVRHRHAIDRTVLFSDVLPLTAGGVALGLVIATGAPEIVLKRLLGIFVTIVAGRDLLTILRASESHSVLPRPLRKIGLVAAGVMHGVYATGGPLLVYVFSRSGLDKGAFRSTIMVVWVVLDVLLLSAYVASGRLEMSTIWRSIALVPSLLVALVGGEWVHRHLDERSFRMVTMVVLALIGALLAFQS